MHRDARCLCDHPRRIGVPSVLYATQRLRKSDSIEHRCRGRKSHSYVRCRLFVHTVSLPILVCLCVWCLCLRALALEASLELEMQNGMVRV